MTSETDQQFMDRVDLDLDLNNTADIQRLFALARRGAAMDEAHAVGFRDGAAHMHKAQAARIERLEAALRFYAGWPQGSAGNIAPFLMDAGRIARAALEGK